ncbi:MAG: Mur ligase family protein, partial [Acidimicrobiales bacterium]
LSRLSAGREIAIVSGTNGKTTTTRLLASAIGGDRRVVTNSTGANLASGLAATLSATPQVESAVLEVDEGLVPAAVGAMRPRLAVLLNLSRDQLDRAGEVRMHAARWRAALAAAPATEVVANADDPLVAWAAEGAGNVVTWVATDQRWRLDATTCPSCSGRIEWRRPEDPSPPGAPGRRGDRSGTEQPEAWLCDGCGR